jgi:hypothetical protein
MRTDKAHAISVSSHNQCHHKVKFIHQIHITTIQLTVMSALVHYRTLSH